MAGTESATVMATQTKKAGRRICEKRPLVFLLAQWNRLTMRPWNWRSRSHQPSSFTPPCPSESSSSGDSGILASPGGWEQGQGRTA